MMKYVILFFFFTILSILFRFVIGNPITSSRMQTKYKLKSIPNILNIVLFFNISKKAIAIQVIAFQLQNYIMFFICLIFKNEKYFSDMFYFKFECFAGFMIIILPLFLEEIIEIINGEIWHTPDNIVELSFDDYQIIFFLKNEHFILNFSTYIGNQIVFWDKNNKIVGNGIINYKKKTLCITELNLNIPYLQEKNNLLCFTKTK